MVIWNNDWENLVQRTIGLNTFVGGIRLMVKRISLKNWNSFHHHLKVIERYRQVHRHQIRMENPLNHQSKSIGNLLNSHCRWFPFLTQGKIHLRVQNQAKIQMREGSHRRHHVTVGGGRNHCC